MGVIMDDGYAVTEDVPKGMRVDNEEVNAAGGELPPMDNVQVEFGIWKTPKGEYRVYNMTLPGGLPVKQTTIENRQVHDAQVKFTGKVEMWYKWKDFGFIKPDAV